MLLIEGRDGYRVEVVTPAPWRFWCGLEARLYVWYGPGPVGRIPLIDGRVLPFFREDVEAVCAWTEGPGWGGTARPRT
jgi:hypothetical protein